MIAKGYKVDRDQLHYNIIYIEGCDEDGRRNSDSPGLWNDRRLLVVFERGVPVLKINEPATTEPGLLVPPLSSRKKGVFALPRIAFGQHVGCWRMGFHKQNIDHPALVQVKAVPISRDTDRDGKRSKSDSKFSNVIIGLNQHTVSRHYNGGFVGQQSLGCLVCRNRTKHQEFLDFLKFDPRYVEDQNYAFTTTVINGDELAQLFPVK